MKEFILKRKFILIVIALVTIVSGYFFYRYISDLSRKSRAAGETAELFFVPTSVTAGIDQTFTLDLEIKPSGPIYIRGYRVNIDFDTSLMDVSSINYAVGRASVNLGADETNISEINTRNPGLVKIIGEVTDSNGYLLDTRKKIATITFVSKSTNQSSLTSNTAQSYVKKINADFTIETLSLAQATITVNAPVSTNTPTPTEVPPGITESPIPTGTSDAAEVGQILLTDGHTAWYNICDILGSCNNWAYVDFRSSSEAGRGLPQDKNFTSYSQYRYVKSPSEIEVGQTLLADGRYVWYNFCNVYGDCGSWSMVDLKNNQKNLPQDKNFTSYSQYRYINSSGELEIGQQVMADGHNVWYNFCSVDGACGDWTLVDFRSSSEAGRGLPQDKNFTSYSQYRRLKSSGETEVSQIMFADGHRAWYNFCSVDGACGDWTLIDFRNSSEAGRGLPQDKNFTSYSQYRYVPVSVPPRGNTTLNIKLKFQGITAKPVGGNQMNVKVKVAGGNLSQPVESSAVFTVDDGGIWSGTTAFNLDNASNYRVYIKGPKHIQKRVCHNAPAESWPGTYGCFDGEVALKPGNNDLDFSNIIQLVGDLPDQDGVVNAYDISFIRNNLQSRDAHNLSIGDLNLDGVIDTQDHSLVISALSIKYDEE